MEKIHDLHQQDEKINDNNRASWARILIWDIVEKVWEVESFLVWGPSSSMWVPELDQQHREMLEIINEFILAKDWNEMNIILSNLFRCVLVHWELEIAFLKSINFPGTIDHNERHSSLMIQFWSNDMDFLSHMPYSKWHFITTLKDWWNHHVIVSDMEFVKFIKEQKINTTSFFEKIER